MVNDHLIELPPPRGLREARPRVGLALGTAWIGAARIGALFLDLAVAFPDANRPLPPTAFSSTPPLVAAALVAKLFTD